MPMMTASGERNHQHATSTPAKSKLAANAASSSGDMDIYASPATSTSSAIESPTDKKSPSFNERFGMGAKQEPQRFDLSPKVESLTSSSPPGIPQAWLSPTTHPVPAHDDADLDENVPVENFMAQMRKMFEKTTAQKTPKRTSTASATSSPPSARPSTSPTGEGVSSVEAVASPVRRGVNTTEAVVSPPVSADSMASHEDFKVIVVKFMEEIKKEIKDEKTEVKKIVKAMDIRAEVKQVVKLLEDKKTERQKHKNQDAIALFDANSKEFLSRRQMRYLRGVQRQFAKEYIAAIATDRHLQIWLKEVDKEGTESFHPEESGPDERIEEMEDQYLQPPQPLEAETEEEQVLTIDEDHDGMDSVENVIIAKVWESFKKLNPTCQEERGSAFYISWKSNFIAKDPVLRYIAGQGSKLKTAGINPKTSKTIIESIDGEWPCLKELKKIFENLENEPEPDDAGLDALSPFETSKGKVEVDAIKGIIKEGKWLRIRNGMTMDSGASVFVMPSDWLDMFELRESVGSRRGQTYVAAAKNGKPILNEGEKVVKFFTKPSLKAKRRKLIFQIAKVNKMLASVAGFCDADNEVIFRKKNGIIRNLIDGEITPFRRLGNIYVMDAYIPNPDYDQEDMDVDMGVGDAENPDFARLGER